VEKPAARGTERHAKLGYKINYSQPENLSGCAVAARWLKSPGRGGWTRWAAGRAEESKGGMADLGEGQSPGAAKNNSRFVGTAMDTPDAGWTR
jgi:hypothetical protein